MSVGYSRVSCNSKKFENDDTKSKVKIEGENPRWKWVYHLFGLCIQFLSFLDMVNPNANHFWFICMESECSSCSCVFVEVNEAKGIWVLWKFPREKTIHHKWRTNDLHFLTLSPHGFTHEEHVRKQETVGIQLQNNENSELQFTNKQCSNNWFNVHFMS